MVKASVNVPESRPSERDEINPQGGRCSRSREVILKTHNKAEANRHITSQNQRL